MSRVQVLAVLARKRDRTRTALYTAKLTAWPARFAFATLSHALNCVAGHAGNRRGPRLRALGRWHALQHAWLCSPGRAPCQFQATLQGSLITLGYTADVLASSTSTWFVCSQRANSRRQVRPTACEHGLGRSAPHDSKTLFGGRAVSRRRDSPERRRE